MKKTLVVIGIAIMAIFADYHFAIGSYVRLLSGWSYLGWLLIFLICLWLFGNWLKAFASILFVAVLQDIGLRILQVGLNKFYPYPLSSSTSQIYGWWANWLNYRWLGLPDGYFIAIGLAMLLILFDKWRNMRRKNVQSL